MMQLLERVSGAVFRGAGAISLGAVLVFMPGTAAQSRDESASFADLAQRLSPAVVNISTTQTLKPGEELPDDDYPDDDDANPDSGSGDDPSMPFDEPDPGSDAAPGKVQSLGSGFVVDPRGIIVTNNHVIDGADTIEVNFTDGSTLPARLIGHDPKTDLAVLKVDTRKPLAAVAFGDSNKARVGDWVLAIGNPFGLSGTVTAGIISAKDRAINNPGPYDDYIQTDASINRGNSGGPLFDLAGQVIGINTAIISPSGGSVGIGFAVPSDTAKQVVAQLEKFGETRRGWLGVRIQSVTPDIAEGLGLKSPGGALVSGITSGGPADKAGIATGDVIVAFNGRAVPTDKDLPRAVAESPIGAKVPVEIIRNGVTKTFTVTLGRLENADGEQDAPKKPAMPTAKTVVLGISLSDVTADLRDKYSIPTDLSGVVVTGVAGDSDAAAKGVQPGDVIIEVAQRNVRKPEEVKALVEAERTAGHSSVLLLISSVSGDRRFIAVKIEGK
ncbi:MAG: DegQ family serine endoprotease [Parvibaculaceae bacterium]|nr:DegQ family serine endoprotease [Parvibaculaceae bacterium]